MAVKELHIVNRRTGNVRVIDYHVADASDPEPLRTFHAKHPPILHVDLQIGPDELVQEWENEEHLPFESDAQEARQA
ncbi:MAG TPA: hypothetical protein VKB67_01995 [Rhizomicrobium sp.]|nr:hypothetical protein [Rhizomicrobium sp.]